MPSRQLSRSYNSTPGHQDWDTADRDECLAHASITQACHTHYIMSSSPCCGVGFSVPSPFPTCAYMYLGARVCVCVRARTSVRTWMYLCVCVHVCICTSMLVNMSGWVGTCVWRPEDKPFSYCSSCAAHLLLLLCLASWNSARRLRWLAGELQRPTYFNLTNSGVTSTCHHNPVSLFFNVVTGDQTQALLLAGQGQHPVV